MNPGVQFTWTKNRLRFCLRLNFDSMICCLNYLFLDFFQYRTSQADSQAVSRAGFQAVFLPCELNPSLLAPSGRQREFHATSLGEICASEYAVKFHPPRADIDSE